MYFNTTIQLPFERHIINRVNKLPFNIRIYISTKGDVNMTFGVLFANRFHILKSNDFLIMAILNLSVDFRWSGGLGASCMTLLRGLT